MARWIQSRSQVILRRTRIARMTRWTKLTICLIISCGIRTWRIWRNRKKMSSLRKSENKTLVRGSYRTRTKLKMIARWLKATTMSAKKKMTKISCRKNNPTKRWHQKTPQIKGKETLRNLMKMRKWV